MKEKLDCLNLYQMEKVMTQPHYPNNLSLDTILLICHTVQSCNYGKCDDCKRTCQIKQFRHRLNLLKPSFCPGDYRRCPRASKLQSCGPCRRKALDLSIKASEVAYPAEKLDTKNKITLEEILELEKLIEKAELEKHPRGKL